MGFVTVFGQTYRIFAGQRLTFPGAHGTTGVGAVAYDQVDTEGRFVVGRGSKAREYPEVKIYEKFDPKVKRVKGPDGSMIEIGKRY